MSLFFEHCKQSRGDTKSVLARLLDPALLTEVAEAIATHFLNSGITRVLTSSPAGIALAYKTAELLSAKAVFAKPCTEEESYSAVANARTNTVLSLPKRYLTAADTVLIVDDTLATGRIASALLEITRQSGAALCGIGVALEKKSHGASDKLRARGIEIFSAVTETEGAGGIPVFEKNETT